VPARDGRSWKDALRGPKWAVEREVCRRQGTTPALQRLISLSKLRGEQFHQREVRSDPELLSWVCRPDYLSSYQLPSGWDQLYLPRSPM
jgi:hypothetical protein